MEKVEIVCKYHLKKVEVIPQSPINRLRGRVWRIARDQRGVCTSFVRGVEV